MNFFYYFAGDRIGTSPTKRRKERRNLIKRVSDEKLNFWSRMEIRQRAYQRTRRTLQSKLRFAMAI